MGMEHRRTVFGVELCAYVPALLGYLDDFHKVGSRVDARTLHALGFKLLQIGIVELITMAMSFPDERYFSVGFPYATAFHQFAFVGTQTHGASHLRDVLLFLHHVNHVVGRRSVHFAAVGILVTQHIARKFDNHHLHAQTDAEGGDVVRATVFGCNDLPFDTSCAEAGADDETCQACQFLGYVLVGDLFAVDKDGFHLVAVVCACMSEAFNDAFVGILQVIFADQSNRSRKLRQGPSSGAGAGSMPIFLRQMASSP